MKYFVGKRPAILKQDKEYPYYISIVGLSSIYNWREPARALNTSTVHEYIKYLKDRYDVSIRLNWGPGFERILGLHIDFKHQSDAEAVVKICNWER